MRRASERCSAGSTSGLTNVRVIQHDAVEVVRDMIAPAIARRRACFLSGPVAEEAASQAPALQPPFVSLLASRLAPGGYLHVATDWEEYAEQILAVLSAEPLLHNTAGGYSPRPEHRPLTKFEQRGLRLGHGVRDLIFKNGDGPRFSGSPGQIST
jgi:tRNA (guanine-N7-)-methyltransferase